MLPAVTPRPSTAARCCCEPRSEILNRQVAKNAKARRAHSGKKTEPLKAPRARFRIPGWRGANIVFLATQVRSASLGGAGILFGRSVQPRGSMV